MAWAHAHERGGTSMIFVRSIMVFKIKHDYLSTIIGIFTLVTGAQIILSHVKVA